MFGFGLEAIVDSGSFPKVAIHRRIVTPLFYLKLKPKDYTYTVNRSSATFVFALLGVCIPVFAPKGKAYERGGWGLVGNSNSQLLEGVMESYIKLVDS